MTVWLSIVRTECLITFRRGGAFSISIGFLFLVIMLFPIGVGPEESILRVIASGVIWITVLLAAVISLESLFRGDLDDGTLEYLALSALPLEVIVSAKCVAQWLTWGLPVVVLSPLMALLMGLDPVSWPVLIMSLAIGTPTLCLLGAAIAALTTGARRGGAIFGLLVLPLFLPVLVFGVLAVEASLAGQSPLPHLLIECAIFVVSVPVGLFGSASALRLAIEAA